MMGFFFNILTGFKANMKPELYPFESKAVCRLIQRSVFEKAGGKRRPKDLLRNSLLSRFPLDIQHMILDLLDHRDFARMWRAIDWPVGKYYWRRRAPKDIIYELRDIRKNDDYVDWEYLCLGLGRLLKTGQALIARRRALDLLQGPRDIFHKLLKEERMK